MFTDPHQYFAAFTVEHDELVRAATRESIAAQIHPWHQPLTSTLAAIRLSLGSGLVHLGERVQGTRATASAASV